LCHYANIMSKYFDVKKDLSQDQRNELDALKAELDMQNAEKARILKEMHDIDPSSTPKGKRSAKRDQTMDHLMDLAIANKELKRVGWMNSEESAKAFFNQQNQKYAANPMDNPYRNWYAEVKEISGDGVDDVIIRDGSHSVRGVNGNTITKSKYPERQLYFEKMPLTTERRAIRDKRGNPINYGKYPQTGQIIGDKGKDPQTGKILNPEYVGKKLFHDGVYKKIRINPQTGDYGWENEQAQKLITMTPYKLFINGLLKEFWAMTLKQHLINNGIPPYLLSRCYGILKTETWSFFKYIVITDRNIGLGQEYPNNPVMLKSLESSAAFKAALNEATKIAIKEHAKGNFWNIMTPAVNQAIAKMQEYVNNNM